MGEEHLRGAQVMAPEAALVALHEPHLAYGSGGLQLVHGLRPPRPAQAQHAFGDGAARDEDHAPAAAHESRDLIGPASDRLDVKPAPRRRDE